MSSRLLVGEKEVRFNEMMVDVLPIFSRIGLMVYNGVGVQGGL